MHYEMPWYVVLFIIATAVGVLLQALILLAMFIGLRKTQKKLEQIVDDARVHLMPAIASSRSLIDDLSPTVREVVSDLTPKIKLISTNLVETTTYVRREAENLKAALDDVVGNTRSQAARVDRMVTGTLDGVEHATATIQHGVSVPIRKMSGWIAGIKAGLEVLGRRTRATPTPPAEGSIYPSKVSGDVVDGEFIDTARVSESDLFV